MWLIYSLIFQLPAMQYIKRCKERVKAETLDHHTKSLCSIDVYEVSVQKEPLQAKMLVTSVNLHTEI